MTNSARLLSSDGAETPRQIIAIHDVGDKTGFRKAWWGDKRGERLSSRVTSGKASEKGVTFDLGFKG